METIEIMFNDDGQTVLTVKGVKGKSCKDATAEIEKILGETTNSKATSEMYLTPGSGVGVSNK